MLFSIHKELIVYKYSICFVEGKHSVGTVVSPSEPRTEMGLYWGYNVRLAQTFGAVFTQCPFKDGYDVTIGTSERGKPARKLKLPRFKQVSLILYIFYMFCKIYLSYLDCGMVFL